MMEKLLPRLQIFLVVLFSLSALFGPLLLGDLRALLVVLVAVGLLLGGVTAAIGWRMLILKQAVVYPFSAWSVQVLRPFVAEGQLAGLARRPAGVPNRVQAAASLALGVLLVAAMSAAGVMVFTF